MMMMTERTDQTSKVLQMTLEDEEKDAPWLYSDQCLATPGRCLFRTNNTAG
jgi:hypothetical protein